MSGLSNFLLLILFAILAGCSNSSTPATPPPAGAVKANPEGAPESRASIEPAAAGDGLIQSVALQQAMLKVATELMTGQAPDVIQKKVDDAIVQIRKDVPDFLMLSKESEKSLQAGTPLEGADKRIAEAASFLNSVEVPLTGLVTSLLPQHKAGKLSAVQKELLAQLIVADMKKTQTALTK